MSQKQYVYEPLGPDDVRLLELHAGLPDSDLRGVLHRYRLPGEDLDVRNQQDAVWRWSGNDVAPLAPNYSSLSYTWGKAQPDTSFCVYLLQDGHFCPVALQPNLFDALKRLRKTIPTDQTRLFWVDAISVHQVNIPEKNQQVQKMAQIYNHAVSVSVWLGNEDATSKRAVSFIERLLKLEDFDPLTQDHGTSVDWEALHSFMNRPWFSRRWIVQEISLSRHAVLYCGDDSIEWTSFCAATALFAARHRDLRQLFQRSSDHGYHPDFLGESEALGATSLVDITTNLFRKNEEGVVLERVLSLEALIATLTLFEAASPHDIIYAVLWLAHDVEPDVRSSAALNFDPIPSQSPEIEPETTQLDTQLQSQRPFADFVASPRPSSPAPPNTQEDYMYSHMPPPQSQVRRGSGRGEKFLKPPRRGSSTNKPARSASDVSKMIAETHFLAQPHAIQVDYDKDVYDVYRQFLEYCIGRSKSLDILCHPWAPEPLGDAPSLPTWIPQLSSAPFERRPGSNSFVRVKANSLCGTPGVGSKPYNASGKTKAYPPKGFIQGRTLIATGFIIDSVGVKKTPAVEGIIPASWLDLVNWRDSSEPVPERFWRTLVADRGPDGHRYPPAYFSSACSYVYSKRARRGNLNTTELLTYGKCPSIAAEFLRRVQAVVWDRALSMTEGRKKSKKLLALVPSDTEEGDLICILYGCSVPVVLRRQRKRKAEDGGSQSRLSGRVYNNFLGGPPISLSRATSSTTVSDIESNGSMRGSQTDVTSAFTGGDGMKRTACEHDSPPPSEENPLPVNLDSQHQYQFIGECYVHGMMAGEGFKHQADHKNKLRVFHII